MRSVTRFCVGAVAAGLLLAVTGTATAQPTAPGDQPEPSPPGGKGQPAAGPDRPLVIAEPPAAVYRPLELPMPQRFAPEDRSRSEYDSYYTGRAPMRVGTGLRVAPGVSGRVSGDPSFAFALDVLFGGRIGLHPGDEQWVLVPETGYTLRTPGGEHQLSVGLGLGYGEGDCCPWNDAMTMFSGFSYVPRFIVDPSGAELALGFRHGVLWDFSENTLAAEIGHQYTRKDGQDMHDLRASLSLDVLLMIILFAGR